MRPHLEMIVRKYSSPAGTLWLGSVGNELCLCDWQDPDGSPGTSIVIDAAAVQLDEYFAGKRTTFDLPLRPRGTDFQQEVWRELLTIPYGATTSYSEIARRIGRPRAVRAVANAIGANPISILIPCHRVVGSSGMLTGYRGGLQAKRTLLAVERTIL